MTGPGARDPNCSISVVIPWFVESETEVLRTVERVHRILAAQSLEVIIVDDLGSHELVRGERLAQQGVMVLSHDRNQGKGRSLRDGIVASSGESIIVVDCDLPYEDCCVSHFVDQWLRLECVLLVTARKRSAESGSVVWSRELASRVFRALWVLLFGSAVTDPQSCLKAMRGSWARMVVSSLTSDSWSLDAELVALALSEDVTTAEVQCNWLDVRARLSMSESVVRLFSMCWELILIRLRTSRKRTSFVNRMMERSRITWPP